MGVSRISAALCCVIGNRIATKRDADSCMAIFFLMATGILPAAIAVLFCRLDAFRSQAKERYINHWLYKPKLNFTCQPAGLFCNK